MNAGGKVKIPDGEAPDTEAIQELSPDEFWQLAYRVWWNLGAACSDLCFGRVGRLIGRSAGSVNHHYKKGGWRDRRDADIESGAYGRPGIWLIDKIKYRVAPETSYLLPSERVPKDSGSPNLERELQRDPAGASISDPLPVDISSSDLSDHSGASPVMRVDKFADIVIQELAGSDVRTQDGVQKIISALLQTFKDAVIEGRVNVSKIVDFERLVRLRNEMITGTIAGGNNIKINIVTAIPRPGDNSDPNVEQMITVERDGGQAMPSASVPLGASSDE